MQMEEQLAGGARHLAHGFRGYGMGGFAQLRLLYAPPPGAAAFAAAPVDLAALGAGYAYPGYGYMGPMHDMRCVDCWRSCSCS